MPYPSTEFSESVPQQKPCLAECAEAIQPLFERFGLPAEFQTDNGAAFASAVTGTCLAKCGITSIQPFTPELHRSSDAKTNSHAKRDAEVSYSGNDAKFIDPTTRSKVIVSRPVERDKLPFTWGGHAADKSTLYKASVRSIPK